MFGELAKQKMLPLSKSQQISRTTAVNEAGLGLEAVRIAWNPTLEPLLPYMAGWLMVN